ncbi:hypothetical protein [Pseudomonas mangiferae]|uniref:F0F1-type ATP synthase subunit beta n=1 Tax=Pseudomonas mangiferae TaxID=2593654 RepID=A0A553GZE8_9PSED|nr:hypothetical protein [Pseudomonas mangiferae]TRX74858.1 hypothetical protein FM069_10025 [Pseudomonas mangiferae]
MTRHLPVLLLSLTLGLCCPPASAADPSASLAALQRMRVASQQSLTDFYLFSGMEGDRRYAQALDDSTKAASTALDQLGELPGDGSRALVDPLRQAWQDYASHLTTLVQTYRSQGFTDPQPVTDTVSRQRRLRQQADALYLKIEQDAAWQVPPLTQRARDLGLFMADIATAYAARNASVGGGASGKGSDLLDRQVDEFDKRLHALAQATENTDATRQALQRVETTWRYLQPTLRNHDENSAPMVVNSYAGQIVEGLETLAGQYAAMAK